MYINTENVLYFLSVTFILMYSLLAFYSIREVANRYNFCLLQFSKIVVRSLSFFFFFIVALVLCSSLVRIVWVSVVFSFGSMFTSVYVHWLDWAVSSLFILTVEGNLYMWLVRWNDVESTNQRLVVVLLNPRSSSPALYV